MGLITYTEFNIDHILKWIPAANLIFLALFSWYASIVSKMITRMEKIEDHQIESDNRITIIETRCDIMHSISSGTDSDD